MSLSGTGSRGTQTVRTPRWLIERIEREFGPITLDAAANHKNAVVPAHLGPGGIGDGLFEWPASPHIWCNPPFSAQGKFVRRAFEASLTGSAVTMLVMASIDSRWWIECVSGIADVYVLHPRIVFVGHATPFPRATAILRYPGGTRTGGAPANGYFLHDNGESNKEDDNAAPDTSRN